MTSVKHQEKNNCHPRLDKKNKTKLSFKNKSKIKILLDKQKLQVNYQQTFAKITSQVCASGKRKIHSRRKVGDGRRNMEAQKIVRHVNLNQN